MTRFTLATVALATASVAAVLSGQNVDSPPVFRTGVRVVQVDAYVTDAQGNPATGLTATDFELRESGKVQTISYFLPFNVPADTRPNRPSVSPAVLVDPDAQTNQAPEGRVYVIAVDELRPANGLRTRIFLRRFVEQHFGPNDVAALVMIGKGRRSDAQEFTSSRRLLLRGIDLISGWPESTSPDLLRIQERMAALRDLAESLGRIPSRRKALLFFTEDVGVDVASAAETPSSASVNRFYGDIAREMVRAALRHNVTIYPIDPSGLDLREVTGESQSGPSIEQDRARREFEVARRANFHALGAVTGGFAVVATNKVDELLERVVRENSAYYLLGYQPTEDKFDGSFRRLQVRVNRPGLQVHTINGYLAPKEKATATRATGMADLLSVPLAVSGLPMKGVAAPYRGEKNLAVIAAVVEVDGKALRLEKKGEMYTGQLDVGYVASGREGATALVQNRINLMLQTNTYEKIRATGLRLLLEPTLPAGLYQLRIGVSQVGGASGSVVTDLEVPDFNKEEFTLGGVSLTSKQTSSLHVTAGANALKDALPGPMTAIRSFASDDELAVYLEVYDNMKSSSDHSVIVRTELRSTDGIVVRTIEQERSSATPNRKQNGYGFLFEIPLSGVPQGSYVLHLEANANVDGRMKQTRDIPIQVVR